jgi:hypothetical protein
MESSAGRVVFNERGYIILELLGRADCQGVIGFSLIGPHASESIIYASRLQALEALQDIEARLSGS